MSDATNARVTIYDVKPVEMHRQRLIELATTIHDFANDINSRLHHDTGADAAADGSTASVRAPAAAATVDTKVDSNPATAPTTASPAAEGS